VPEGFRIASAYVEVHAETAPLFAEVAAAVKAISAKSAAVRVKTEADAASIAKTSAQIRAGLAGVAAKKVKVGVDFDEVAFARAMSAADRASMNAMNAMGRYKLSIDKANVSLGQQVTEHNNINKALLKNIDPARRTWAEIYKMRQETQAAEQASNRLWGVWRALGAQVSLFGGARTVSAWHLALDGVIEALAVLVPATVTALAGLGAFAVAGSDSFRQLYHRVIDTHTVMDALNATIPPFTGNLEKLHQTVRPQVWQLYGDAIMIAKSNTGLFNDLAVKTGGIIDRIAAAITYDLTRGSSGLHTFLAAGARDLSVLSQIGQNLGHVIFRLIQVTQETHIAEYLLGAVNAASKLLAAIANLPLPLLAVVAGLHGIYLWGGLAVTWISKLGSALVTGGLAALAYGERVVIAAKNSGLLAGALAALPKIPIWGWVGIGVIALGGLAYWLSKSKDATDKWIISLNNAVAKASIWQSFTVTISAIQQTASKLAAAQADLAQQSASVATHLAAGAHAGGLNAIQTNRLAGDVHHLSQEKQNLILGLQSESVHLGIVAVKYGTTLPGAMALAVLAGVKVKDLQSSSAEVWAKTLIQIDGIVAGYKAMGITGGRLGAALAVMTISESDQLRTVQQLNSAYDQWITNLAAPRDTFIAFARSLVSFGQDAKASGASMDGLGGAIAKMTRNVGTASLNLQADFQNSFEAANQMFDALRTSGASGHVFTGVVKDLVATLIPLAQGNKAALAEISALAQEAGGPATTSVHKLQDWVGKSINPLKGAQDAANKLTIQNSKLSESAKKLSATLQDDLNAIMAQTIVKTSGVRGAMEKYTEDLRHNQDQTRQGQADRKNLISDLEKAGLNATQAKTFVQNLTTAIHNIPGSKKVTFTVDGIGHYKVSGQLPGVPASAVFARAGGGVIPGYAPGIDSIPAMLSPGEGVLVPEAVRALGPGWLYGINKAYAPGRVSRGSHFAAGGLAAGSADYSGGLPGLGTWTVNNYNATVQVLARAVFDATKQGIAQGIAASSGMGGIPGRLAAGAGTAMQIARRLLAAMGWAGQWGAFNSLVMAESGWNVHATNPSSGAYGIPQALPASKMASAGSDWRDNPATQLRWMMGYIAGRYGSPSAAWAHEQSFHWYGKGTGGAVPGWAWVGERGPELVHMHGGEIVLDAATSALVNAARNGFAGYAGGTPQPGEFCSVADHGKTRDGLVCRRASDGRWRWEHLLHHAGGGRGGGGGGGGGHTSTRTEMERGLRLIEGFASAKTAANVLADMRNFLKVIAEYYHGSAARHREALVERQARAMEITANKISALSSKISQARQYQADTLSGLQSYADLGSLSSQGPIFRRGITGGQGIELQLQGKLANLKKFAAALTKLSRAKVPSSLIRQIVALGPDAGLQYANEILAGGSSLIRQISATESQIAKEETAVSQVATNAVFGLSGTGKSFLAGLLSQQKALDALFRREGRILAQEAARWFHVPRSKMPKSFDSGGWLMPGEMGMNYGHKPEMVLTAGHIEQLGEVLARKLAPVMHTSPVVNFHGTQWPSPEQRTHLMRELTYAAASIR
jgi:hypothetical protein